MMGWLLSATVLGAWLILATRWFGSGRRDDGAALRSHQHALDRLRHADGSDAADGADTDGTAAHVRLLPARTGRSPADAPPAPARTRAGKPSRARSTPPPSPPASVPPEDRVDPPTITRHEPESEPEPEPVPPAPERLADLLPLRAPGRQRRFAGQRLTRLAVGGVLVVALVAAAAVFAANPGRDDSSVTADDPETEPAPPPSSAPEPETPPMPAVRLLPSEGSTLAYAVSGERVSVTIAATAPCWVEVRSAADEVVFQGTLGPGEQPTFEDPAALMLRVGNPGAATMQVNGVPLELPPDAADGSPVDLDIRIEAALQGVGAAPPPPTP